MSKPSRMTLAIFSSMGKGVWQKRIITPTRTLEFPCCTHAPNDQEFSVCSSLMPLHVVTYLNECFFRAIFVVFIAVGGLDPAEKGLIGVICQLRLLRTGYTDIDTLHPSMRMRDEFVVSCCASKITGIELLVEFYLIIPLLVCFFFFLYIYLCHRDTSVSSDVFLTRV